MGADMMRLGSTMFDERNGSVPKAFSQVMLIISDGRFNKEKVRPWVHTALSQQQLPLLIIVDKAMDSSKDVATASKDKVGSSGQARKSVFELRQVSYEGGQC